MRRCAEYILWTKIRIEKRGSRLCVRPAVRHRSLRSVCRPVQWIGCCSVGAVCSLRAGHRGFSAAPNGVEKRIRHRPAGPSPPPESSACPQNTAPKKSRLAVGCATDLQSRTSRRGDRLLQRSVVPPFSAPADKTYPSKISVHSAVRVADLRDRLLCGPECIGGAAHRVFHPWSTVGEKTG